MKTKLTLLLLMIVFSVSVNQADQKFTLSLDCDQCVIECYTCLTGQMPPNNPEANLYAYAYEGTSTMNYNAFGNIVAYARSTGTVDEKKMKECKTAYTNCLTLADCE